jgi:hypothetical protein
MSGAPIAWTGGGTAELLVIDGDRVELVSTRAFAPGSRPEGTFTAAPTLSSAGATAGFSASTGPATDISGSPASPAGHPIWMKVHGSRRQEDGTYRVKGRLLNVRRDVLDLLKEVVGGSNGGKSSTS